MLLTLVACEAMQQDLGLIPRSVAVTYGPGDPNNPQPIRPVRGSERLHFVERGDSIFKIVRLYGITPQQLQELNQLDANYTIYAGTFLIIPGFTDEPLDPPEPFEPRPVEPVDSAPLDEPT